jgi:Xaa-Pro dipeptidase
VVNSSCDASVVGGRSTALRAPANRHRAAELMQAHGLDGVLLTSPTNVFYLTGDRSPLDDRLREWMLSAEGSGERPLLTCALLPAEGEPVLFLATRFAANALELDVQVEAYDTTAAAGADDRPTDAAAAVARAVRERGLRGSRLAVELDGLWPAGKSALSEALATAQLRDCSNLVRLVRAMKTEGEIANLATAAAIAEAAAMEALASLRGGELVDDLALRFRVLLARRGADLAHFAAAPRGFGLAFASSHELARGDALLIDFGCIHNGYFSDTATTVSVGRADDDTAFHSGALEAVAAGREAARPGVAASELYEAMRRQLGPVGELRSPPKGHGLGIELRDYPLIGPTSGRRITDDCVNVPADIELDQGMVINLEGLGYLPGRASYAVEQTFVVEAGGGRLLTKQERHAPVEVAA